jgi:asparagine synthase (glutamine-hydrolysing)
MRDPETGNWIVLNGEIYNHRDIRRELAENTWRSSGDTETVLRAYARWGPACVERLRGMFAMAIYDATRRTLWCSRDRLGIKPFYFAKGAAGFAFASEVRALLASGLLQNELDPAGVATYMRFGSVIEPFTLVRGIRSLSAGHWLEVKDGSVEKECRYWALDSPTTPASRSFAGDAAEETSSEMHLSARTRELLEQSIREHMLSDGPVACFLSGGIDSSIVTAMAASASPLPLRTFTVAFPGTSMDESDFACEIAHRFKTEHVVVRLSDQEVARQVPLAVAAMDLPSMDGVNTYMVSGAVRANGIKVVLSGLGGDELFGGYRSFRLLPFALKWSGVLGNIPKFMEGLVPGGARGREMMRPGVALRDRYSSLRSLWPSAELARMGFPEVIGASASECETHLFLEPDTSLPPLTRVSLLEISGYMRSVLLRDSDVMSMAHSIELRVPFLDHRMVEHCLRHHLAGAGRKTALLHAAPDLLPRRHTMRAKQGFELPIKEWLAGNSAIQRFAEDGLAALDRAAVLATSTQEYKRAFEATRLRWPRLWQLVVLGQWLRNSGTS